MFALLNLNHWLVPKFRSNDSICTRFSEPSVCVFVSVLRETVVSLNFVLASLLMIC